MKHGRLFVPCIVAALTAACVGRQATVPEDVYYRLPDPRPAEDLSRPLVRGQLSVSRIETRGLHQERALLYADANHPNELRRYHYHHWTDTPGRVVQQHLIAYMRAVGAAGSVTRHEPGMAADAAVSGRLLRFERVLDGGAGVVVAVELSYREPPSDAARLSREYTVRRRARDRTMAATVETFGAALQEVYRQFLDDVQEVLQRDPGNAG